MLSSAILSNGMLARVVRKFCNVRAVRWLRSSRYLMVLSISAADAQSPEMNDGFSCNCAADLALFEQSERWLSAGEFAREANRRMAEGLKVYTAVHEGRLAHYCWLVPLQERAWFPYVSQHYDFPPGTAVMFNDYTHPSARGLGLHTRSMRRRIWDAVHKPGIQQVYVAIETHNMASRKVASKVGLRCIEVLFETVRLGRTQCGRLSPEAYMAIHEPTDK